MRNKARVARWLTGILCCGFASGLLAAESDAYLPTMSDLPVVLSASRLRQPIAESPASITVIPRDMIEASGARDVVELLRLVPGMQVGRRTRGNPVAAYHGIAERYNPKLQVLIDDRAVYLPIYGGVPWGELPVSIEDIERIEVVRAPNAATFGPNSFSAVVSITTRAPDTLAGWRIHAGGGGNHRRDSTVSRAGRLGAARYRVSLQASNNEGYPDLPDTERDRLIDMRLELPLGARDRLTVGAGLHRGSRVELEPVEVPDQFAPVQDTSNGFLQVTYERDRSSDESTRLQYHFNRYALDEREEVTIDRIEVALGEVIDVPPLTVDLDRSVHSERHEISLSRTMAPLDGLRLVAGGALRHDRVGGGYLFGDDSERSIDTRQAFAHGEWRATPRWTLNAGALYDHTSLSGESVAPRASLLFRARPHAIARLGFSRGIRAPLLLEEDGSIALEYDVGGERLLDRFVVDHGKIEHERSDVYDIGWFQRFVRRGLTLDARLSHHRLRDLVGTRRVPAPDDTFDEEARVFENRFRYRYSAAELELDWAPRPGSHVRLAWSRAFDQDADLARRRLLPRHTLSLYGATRVGARTTLSAEVYRTDEWIWDDVRTPSSLDRLDLRVAHARTFARARVEFAVQGEFDLGGTVDYLERNRIEDRIFVDVRLHVP